MIREIVERARAKEDAFYAWVERSWGKKYTPRGIGFIKSAWFAALDQLVEQIPDLDTLDPDRPNRCRADYHWFGEVPERAPRFRTVGDAFRCELDAQHPDHHRARIRDGDRPGDGMFKTATLVPHRLRASGYRAEIVWGPGDD